MIPQSPFITTSEGTILKGPVFLSCGCGNVTARWATVAQNLVTKLPQVKPKANKIAKEWLVANGLMDKWPVLKQHTYGIVVAETEKGFEMVNIMGGATNVVVQQVAQLIKEHNEFRRNHQTA